MTTFATAIGRRSRRVHTYYVVRQPRGRYLAKPDMNDPDYILPTAYRDNAKQYEAPPPASDLVAFSEIVGAIEVLRVTETFTEEPA